MKSPAFSSALVVLALALCPAPALAQGEQPLSQPTQGISVSELFPMDLGRRWIYRLKVTVADQSKTIEYSTQVARMERVEGIGNCTVFESHSNRLLLTEWYRYDAKSDSLSNVQRMEGKSTERFTGRALISSATLAGLSRPQAAKAVKWAGKSGRAKGTLTIAGKETIRLVGYRNLECVVLHDKGTYTYRRGKVDVVRRQERVLHLAPGIGLVRESMKIFREDGSVLIETLAELKYHEN